MSTLLLRLAGPLQAWGAESKFEIRRTESVPTKSGVIGLLMAALGCKRDDRQTLQILNGLRMGIRVDQPGIVLRDYHTAHGKNAYVTNRYYLSDAVFLVGLESEDTQLLEQMEQALLHPVFPLFLGRRSCPPTLPLCLGTRQEGLVAALRQEPWQAAKFRQRKLSPDLRLLAEGTEGTGVIHRLRDVPISFHPGYRQYGYRFSTECGFVQMKNEQCFESTQHDPMLELGGE
jgi:CRISPR system Cascade subunit CasD